MLIVLSNRTGTAQSPICECGNERETVQHFLFRFPLHREGRICMLDLIKSICASWKDKTHLDISELQTAVDPINTIK